MATFTWEKTTTVPPAKAQAWFFDLREDDHDGPRHKAARGGKPRPKGEGRKILSRTPEKIVTEDTWGKNQMVFTVTRPDDRVVMDGQGMGGKMTSHAEMRFTPAGTGGSKVTMTSDFQATGLWGLLMPLFMGKFKKTIVEDMDIHVADMEEEWKTKPW